MQVFLLLAVADIVNLSKARPQEVGVPLSERIFDSIEGSTLTQPLTLESDPSIYSGGGGIASQTQPSISVGSDLFSDDVDVFAHLFNNGDLNVSYEPPLLTSTGTSILNTNSEPGYDESTMAYDKFPLYTWPSNSKQIVFPFNCWKENKDGFLCEGGQCHMGTNIISFSLISFNL